VITRKPYDALLPSVLASDEARALLDREVRRVMGMSADAFLAKWEAGDLENLPDTPEGREIVYLVLLIPFGRRDASTSSSIASDRRAVGSFAVETAPCRHRLPGPGRNRWEPHLREPRAGQLGAATPRQRIRIQFVGGNGHELLLDRR
jgi:hypothetical protein